MDSMEFQKIFGAVLTAGIAFGGLGLVADNVSHPKRLEKSAIEVKGSEAPAASGAIASAGPIIPPIDKLLITAVVADGQALTKKVCIACHNFKPGGPNKTGPALYGVVGRTQASAPGYKYSTALGGHHEKWTYAELNKWLIKPAAYAPGTKMAYAGIANDQIRADVIDYLRTLSETPLALPTPAEAAAEEAAAKAAASASSAAPADVAAAEPPLEPLLAKADPATGMALTKKVCIACHGFKQDSANKVGPALYGVVGRAQASAPGYKYSTALGSHHGVWTYAELNKWLTKPSAYAHGTKMAYAGISNPQVRADVIDYLHTLSANPLPLPAEAGGKAAKPDTHAEVTPAPAKEAAAQPAPAAPAASPSPISPTASATAASATSASAPGAPAPGASAPPASAVALTAAPSSSPASPELSKSAQDKAKPN
jgi:cytochrome c